MGFQSLWEVAVHYRNINAFFPKKHIKKVENSLKKIRNICLPLHPFLCRLLDTSLLKHIATFKLIFVCVYRVKMEKHCPAARYSFILIFFSCVVAAFGDII